MGFIEGKFGDRTHIKLCVSKKQLDNGCFYMIFAWGEKTVTTKLHQSPFRTTSITSQSRRSKKMKRNDGPPTARGRPTRQYRYHMTSHGEPCWPAPVFFFFYYYFCKLVSKLTSELVTLNPTPQAEWTRWSDRSWWYCKNKPGERA